MTNLIGTRIKALREERGLSQEELSRAFGFKDRQILSAIENGDRRLTADELLLAVEKLGATLDYFTDPFRLDGEAHFSWRQSGLPSAQLTAYERNAGRWIAAYRRLAPEEGGDIPLLRHALTLTRHSSFEDAAAAGERFAAKFGMGEVPASALPAAMEERLGLLVLMVDAMEGISGAACRLPELDTVLINRGEVPGRRHFDLAHELFHILTWDAMAPEHSEEPTETGGNRIEQLANNFASALLMPAAVMDRFGDWAALDRGELVAKLCRGADELKVTGSALKWRLVTLGRLTRARAREIPDGLLRSNRGLFAVAEQPPALFSKPFADVIARALNAGRLSARRAADLLGMTVDDLPGLFREHGIEASVDL